MSLSAQDSHPLSTPAIPLALQTLADRPEWLTAALQPERLRQGLERHVPEIAADSIRVVECVAPRLFLKDTGGRWRGTFHVTVEAAPHGPRRTVPLRVMLTPANLPLAEDLPSPPQLPFGSPGWQCFLPELRLHCELEPPEQALDVLPQLTDPDAARVLLEQSIRAGSSTCRDIRIQACRPEVLNYKPGSRCTIRYHLTYAAAHADRGWPPTVIAKTYRGRKGEQAYRGMAALWHSPLASHQAVRIAEPLAYVPELRLLIQAPLEEEQTLEQLLRHVLRRAEPEATHKLYHFVRQTAVGLAAVHRSGAQADAQITWDERIVEIPELFGRLAVVDPSLASKLTPLLELVQMLAAAHPADALVPSHGSFDGDQVLIAGDQIGFIDFDSFALAEPALDVGHFRAAIMDSGMQVVDEQVLHSAEACRRYLQWLAEIGDVFLEAYLAHAPVSRQRLLAWEGLDYLRDAIQLWTKPKPDGGEGVIRILEYHLRGMGVLDSGSEQAAPV